MNAIVLLFLLAPQGDGRPPGRSIREFGVLPANPAAENAQNLLGPGR